eukprot:CAMPEP_0175285160 /NCGR_PEP_ID=MMETSP0093-20121207/53089_1 /TAXON_ID=311494 /ORGANISM="Alexandrium monilatum, Strain CCMP3105" /LENGTH=58 /DNA_ID=CAMNT_0016580555 /DNA_START=96 /DNA_END=269 /DNA_ORIENTATION=-
MRANKWLGAAGVQVAAPGRLRCPAGVRRHALARAPLAVALRRAAPLHRAAGDELQQPA